MQRRLIPTFERRKMRNGRRRRKSKEGIHIFLRDLWALRRSSVLSEVFNSFYLVLISYQSLVYFFLFVRFIDYLIWF